ncbi:ribonuclease HI [Candidatus Gracilibacteria bacterium]|nr:ribonuclease HI [Candidatus Gracilibacteria bacterium]
MKKIKLYSDGGTSPNPGIGGFGVILEYNGVKKEFCKGFKHSTNNRMELLGVIFGLEQIKEPSKVDVFTDSSYVVNGIEKGWAKKWKANGWTKKLGKVMNIDLWARLLDLIQKHDVEFHWVRGHNGHLENERCDELAWKARRGELFDDVDKSEEVKNSVK